MVWRKKITVKLEVTRVTINNKIKNERRYIKNTNTNTKKNEKVV